MRDVVDNKNGHSTRAGSTQLLSSRHHRCGGTHLLRSWLGRRMSSVVCDSSSRCSKIGMGAVPSAMVVISVARVHTSMLSTISCAWSRCCSATTVLSMSVYIHFSVLGRCCREQ